MPEHWYFRKLTGYGRPGSMTRQGRVSALNERSEDYARASPEETQATEEKIALARQHLHSPLAQRRFAEQARLGGVDDTRVLIPLPGRDAPVLFYMRGQAYTAQEFDAKFGDVTHAG
jgi:hypothetical protein